MPGRGYSISTLLSGKHDAAIPVRYRNSHYGLLCGLDTPCLYRAMRNVGGLEHDCRERQAMLNREAVLVQCGGTCLNPYERRVLGGLRYVERYGEE